MKWSRVIFSGALAHFTPTALKDAVIENIVSRGAVVSKEFPGRPGWPIEDDLKEIGLHLGGSTIVDEPWMDVSVGGVVFKFLARDFDLVLYKIENAKPRHELGRTTYKVHGDLHCIVLLPQQRKALIRSMRAMIASGDVDGAYNAFLVERDKKFPPSAEVLELRERYKEEERGQARNGG